MADDETQRILILLKAQSEAHDKAMRKSAREVERLERKYDPLSRAVIKYEREQEQLNRALEAGTIDAQRHAQLHDRLQKEYRETVAAINDANSMLARQQGALGGVSGFMKRNGNVVQQFGYQVGDFAVQVGSGTSAMTAFAQQGSQMLGALGMWGAIAGAAVAVGVPLVRALTDSGDAAKSLEDRLKDLNEAVSDLNDLTMTYTVEGLDRLKKKYGEVTEEVLDLVEAQKDREIQIANDRSTSVAEKLAAEFRVVALEAGTTGRIAEQQFSVMAHRLKIAKASAKDLADAFYDLRQADSFDDKADALARIRRIILQSSAAGTDLYDALLEAESKMKELAAAAPDANWLSAAIRQAKDLAAALWDAAMANAEARLDDAGNPIPRGVSKSDRPRPAPPGIGGIDWGLPPGTSRSTDSRTAFDPLASGAQQIEALTQQIDMIGKTGTEVAALTAKWQLLAEAKKRKIDLDQVDAATGETVRQQIERQAEEIGKLTEQHERLAERQEVFVQSQEDFKTGMIDAIIEGKNFAGVLEDIAKSFAKAALQAMLFNEGPFSSGTGSGLLGNFFTGAFSGGASGGGGTVTPFMDLLAGARASGGPVSAGKSYLVGEEGPEIFTPRSSGEIIPNTATSNARGAGDSIRMGDIYVTAEGTQTDAIAIAAQVRREMEAQATAIYARRSRVGRARQGAS